MKYSKVSKVKLAIIVPVLNEEQVLGHCLASLVENLSVLKLSDKVEVYISDSGSTDKTLSIARQAVSLYPNVSLVERNFYSAPSVSKALRQLRGRINAEMLCVCPADVSLGQDALALLWKNVEAHGRFYGGFKKIYSDRNLFLRFNEYLLNDLRAKTFKNLVWTNAICFPLEAIELIPKLGFMEDVAFSDALKRSPWPWLWQDLPVIVSARRYKADGYFIRFVSNVLILGLYRMRLLNALQLKAIYQWKFHAGKLIPSMLQKKIS